MKTIRQIADELGVTKQAVSYRLKQLEATKEHGVLAVKENGVLVVSLVGEKLIKSAFLENDRQKLGDKEPPKDHQKDSDILAVLQTTISMLQGQIEIKDRQIDELNSRLAETTTALVTAQQTAQAAQALHAGTIQQQLTSGDADLQTDAGAGVDATPEPRKGFFAKWFSKA